MTDEAREAAWARERIIEIFRSRQYENPNGGPNVFTEAAVMLEADAAAFNAGVVEGIRLAREAVAGDHTFETIPDEFTEGVQHAIIESLAAIDALGPTD